MIVMGHRQGRDIHRIKMSMEIIMREEIGIKGEMAERQIILNIREMVKENRKKEINIRQMIGKNLGVE